MNDFNIFDDSFNFTARRTFAQLQHYNKLALEQLIFILRNKKRIEIEKVKYLFDFLLFICIHPYIPFVFFVQ